MSSIINVPFKDEHIQTVDVDGKPYVVFKPLAESLGLDPRSQRRRLNSRSWVGGVKMTLPSAGGPQETFIVDVRTILMWLATINENQVAEHVRPKLISYQSEVADAIEAYWSEGVAVNPAATEEQLDQAHQVIELMKEAHEPVLAGTSAGSRYMSLFQYERSLGISFTKAQRKEVRKKAWKICGESNLHPRQIVDPDRGKCFSLPEQMWREASFAVTS